MTRLIALILTIGVLIGVLGIALHLDPHAIPSPLIDKPAPAFQLQALENPSNTITRNDLLGRVWILNVWASWCTTCLEELPVLLQFSRSESVPLYGLNYKDTPAEALTWLAVHGNPFVTSLRDADGRAGMDFGVYGVPETFIIDQTGTIRLKYVGPVTADVIRDRIMPMLKAIHG